MDALFATMRKLHPRGPRARGLVVDAEGVMLGPDCVLVRRTADGYRVVSNEMLTCMQGIAFGKDGHQPRLPFVLGRIANALEGGDVVRAQLLGLSLAIGELCDDQLRRLRLAAEIMKSDYNPDEPRDDRGRWTSDGGSAASPGPNGALPLAAGTAAASQAAGAETAVSTGAATLAPEMTSFWTRGALGIAGGTAVMALGAVLVPLNRSNVSEGKLPGSDDISYRYDEGILILSYRGPDGRLINLFDDRPGRDHAYRDSNGNVIARQLDNGEGFVLAPDALPGLAAKIRGNSADRIDPDAVRAAVDAYAAAVAASEPRLCPMPSPDRGKIESLRAAMYQWQVCGLPPGWGVEFNGARFDGCDIPTGTLRECKGPGFADKMKGSVTDDWPWPGWYTLSTEENAPTGMTRIVAQLEKENDAATAGGRPVIVHVAEPALAEWLRVYSARKGYTALQVVHTPAPPFDTSLLLRFAYDHSDWSMEALA